MKKHIVLIGLLYAASSTCALAVERPDGTLGTNYIGVRGLYMNAGMGEYVDSLDLDFAGFGFDINQNLYKDGDIGVDVSFNYNYLTNQNNTDYYGADNYSYTLGATVFREGVVSPYFTFAATHDFLKFNYKRSSESDWDEDALIISGEIGAECHLLPGWSVTPYVVAGVDTDADDDTWTTAVGASTSYWMTERFGFKLGAAYTSKMDIDFFTTYAGVSFHY